jgi:plasmid stabilization system protein ParE
MAALRLTPSAEDQIGDIVEFIANDNEDAAVRVRHALYSAFDLLASRPGISDCTTSSRILIWTVAQLSLRLEPVIDVVAILATAGQV